MHEQQHFQHPNAERDPEPFWTVSKIVLLVTIVMTITSLLLDLPNWKVAHLLNEYEAGNRDTAIEQLEEYVLANESDSQTKIRLANLMKENGQAQKALEIVESLDSRFSRQTKQLKIEILQKLGRFQDAFDLFKEFGRFTSPGENERAVRLNSLSYLRALAGTELKRAEDEITSVIANTHSDQNKRLKIELSLHTKMKIWSALIFQQAGDSQRGIELLTPLADELYDKLRAEIRNEALRKKRDEKSDGPDRQEKIGEPKKLTELERVRQEYAWIMTARAYCLEQSGKSEFARQDQLSVLSTGNDPSKILGQMPGLQTCYQELNNLVAMVDTRGVVLFKKRKYKQALQDLDAAVVGSEAIVLASDQIPGSDRRLSMMTNQQLRLSYLQLHNYRLAIMLNHRSDVLEKLGRTDEADRDRNRIIEMGWQPGAELN